MEAQEFGYFSPEKRLSDTKTTGDNFIVEDLLDFSNNEGIIADGTFDSITGGNSTDSSTVTLVDSCNSSFSAGNDPHFISSGGCGGEVGIRSFATTDTQFSGELCVPYEDLAELEWLSNFVEESFPSEDLEKLQLISGISGIKTGPEAVQYQPDPAGNTTSADSSSDANANINNNSPIFSPEMPVPGKARSKRSRAAPCNWTSRLLVLSPNAAQTQTHTQSQQTSSSESDMVSAMGPKPETKPGPKKKGSSDPAGANGEGRKCLHCATDKTPQWRTGPMGPKTLCNACGVRYKSGRLVPEYRPAASPTFVQTKHSNSHRKVMELRRQKELMRQQQLGQQEQQQQQFIHGNLMFDGSNQDDYLIHQHIGPDFRQLI